MNPQDRKNIRLHGFDYSTNGAYFITICTKGKKPLLGSVVRNEIDQTLSMILTSYGRIVEENIRTTNIYYDTVSIPIYSIMPNHIHLLIHLANDNGNRIYIPRIVNSIKSLSSKKQASPYGRGIITSMLSVIKMITGKLLNTSKRI